MPISKIKLLEAAQAWMRTMLLPDAQERRVTLEDFRRMFHPGTADVHGELFTEECVLDMFLQYEAREFKDRIQERRRTVRDLRATAGEKTILAFLQNMWFKNPEKARAIFERYPEKRNALIKTYLFMGCTSGQNLEAALGEEMCQRIVWEEASPEIGGHSASRYRPDPLHISRAISRHDPDIVLAFGKDAGEGVRAAVKLIHNRPGTEPRFVVLYGPHPAARNNPLAKLQKLAETLQCSVG